MRKQVALWFTLGLLLLVACGRTYKRGEGGDDKISNANLNDSLVTEVQAYLDAYNAEMTGLYYNSSQAHWKLNTEIRKNDTTAESATRVADEAYAAFTGSKENIEKSRQYLDSQAELEPLQVKQLEAILYAAANNPQTVPDLVRARIKADAKQTKNLFGYTFTLNGAKTTPNKLDEILKKENDLNKRLAAWEASKKVGIGLKEGLSDLQGLRNETVQALGFSDFFEYQVSQYGMTTEEMMIMMREMVQQVWPLYREMHTWARYTLAEQYGVEEVPEMLPAHWLPNRWGQDWAAMVEVKGINLDSVLEEKGDKWLVEQAERFYVSLGFDELPETFYLRSSLYPLPPNATYSKNNHASAWHMDLEEDVRSLMSVTPNTEWYETTHHELGHIYYYLTYTNDDVPPLLREGANRGYHEAMGSLMGLAAMQKPFMEGLELIEPGVETDEIQSMLKEALNFVVLIPWGAGVMTEFEHDLYADKLPVDAFNKRWWELKAKYQGIVPPSERGEEFCDACSKTHINNDPAQYYDYAFSNILLFQFHDYIAKNILNQPPQATNYFGSKKVGNFLKKVMYPGASQDWRELMQESIGSDLNATPMLDYFQPLLDWLKEQNKDRKHTLPESLS